MDPKIIDISRRLLAILQKHDMIVKQTRILEIELNNLTRMTMKATAKGDNPMMQEAKSESAIVSEVMAIYKSYHQCLSSQIQIMSAHIAGQLRPDPLANQESPNNIEVGQADISMSGHDLISNISIGSERDNYLDFFTSREM